MKDAATPTGAGVQLRRDYHTARGEAVRFARVGDVVSTRLRLTLERPQQ